VEQDDENKSDITLSAEELTTLSSVPGNVKLQAIGQALRHGEEPWVKLCGFEVAELDTAHGVIYLHDDLLAMYPALPLLKSKDHPILRFKVAFSESEWDILAHPLIRRGKRICVRGRVVASQETILAQHIARITERPYNLESDSYDLGSGQFISPVTNIRCLLWEIGREDMIVPIPQISPVVHGDLNTTNVLVEAGDTGVAVWLIDFSDARPGHIYYDLAKLEVEFRTHVLYRLYKSMIDEGLWDSDTAFKFALLLEDVLWQADGDFADFICDLRDYRPIWYDTLYTQFPLYSENLFYFLFSLRQMAKTHSPERFRYHYPVAVFFQSMAALKFEELENAPWYPWAKRLALCSGLVAGKHAVRGIERPLEVSRILNTLRARSAFALITIGSGEDRRYLLQWNANWDMFNLVGGRMDLTQGDKDSFARTIQRKLLEELGLQSPRDYRIVWEYKPLHQRQFSQRDYIFKDYEFHVFKIEFLPRHPLTKEEYDWFAQKLSPERENVLVSRAEIERLRTFTNRQISTTTRMILYELGEITADERDMPTILDFQLDRDRIVVSRGRAQIVGLLTNPQYADIIENLTLDILPSPAYEAEKDSAVIQIGALNPAQSVPLTIWLHPREKEARIMIRATYYDVRGHEYQQILESDVQFDSLARSSFHVDNPYVVGKPLTAASESLYVGREDVFRWIEENLIGKTQPHTLILYGQRRMGKTSTLYQLVGGHRGKNIREYPGYPIFPVYIDLQRLAGCEMAEFFDRLSHDISRNLHRRGIEVSPPASWSVNGTLFRDFDDFLDKVEDNLPENGLLVLIMDELEQLQVSIERGQLSQDILSYLRSLMQHRTRVTFILVGTNQLVEDYWSIIFHVGISREIVSLTRDETERLIREPVAPMIQYDDLAIERIWLAARGHPYFSQLICHRLISATNLTNNRSKLISIADVRETFDRILEEDDSHLLHLWNECSRDEQLVLASLSGSAELGEEAILRPEIAQRLRHVDFADEVLNQALKSLEQRRLITRQAVEREMHTRLPRPGGWQPTIISKDYAYAVSFDLLRSWIVSKRPLGSLLD
ncbi:MAG: AAA family ATPase, partial [Chloroflexi bacterium]|nr:AAA family ATPase [Chloroflexota bacterium]